MSVLIVRSNPAAAPPILPRHPSYSRSVSNSRTLRSSSRCSATSTASSFCSPSTRLSTTTTTCLPRTCLDIIKQVDRVTTVSTTHKAQLLAQGLHIDAVIQWAQEERVSADFCENNRVELTQEHFQQRVNLRLARGRLERHPPATRSTATTRSPSPIAAKASRA